MYNLSADSLWTKCKRVIWFLQVKPLPEAGQGVFIDKKKSCNHLTSTLYLFANIEYVREVCSQLYLTSIEAISKQGRSFLPHLLHFFCRAVHHAASQTLDENMLDELLAAIAKYMTCSYAFSFTKFGVSASDNSTTWTIFWAI